MQPLPLPELLLGKQQAPLFPIDRDMPDVKTIEYPYGEQKHKTTVRLKATSEASELKVYLGLWCIYFNICNLKYGTIHRI